MCGITHVKRTDITQKANKLTIKRYEKQKHRGNEGYGFIEIRNGFVVSETRTQTEKEILEKLKKSTADEIMFHHRYPTSTPNLIEATHPIKVSNPKLRYNYYVSHNGIITNDDELRTRHIREGYTYTTDITKKWITAINTYSETMWNDSEALAIDFAQAIETGKEMTAKGSIAITAIQFEKETGKVIALYFGRNGGNPLCVENSKEFFALSSETGEDIEADTLYRLDYETNKITGEEKKIGVWTTPKATSYGMGYGYGGYMGSYDYDTYHHTSHDLEEDDFDVDMWEEINALEEAIELANRNDDYDLATELEIELEELKIELDAMKQTGQTGKKRGKGRIKSWL